jgi:S-(hydroxymethyl)glutathione dehydrogenase / alcohol dehydrogenase
LLNLYRDGVLKLDEMITETYRLDQVNEGYADMAAGRVVRGVITL